MPDSLSPLDKLSRAMAQAGPNLDGPWTVNVKPIAGGAPNADTRSFSVWDKLTRALVPTGASLDGPYTLSVTGLGSLVGGPGNAESINIDATTGVMTIVIPSATQNAWIVQDTNSNAYWQTDTRITTSGVTAHTIGNANVTIVAAAGTTFRQLTNGAFTLTLTGGTGVTALNGLSTGFQAPTVSGASLVTTLSTVSISGAPVLAGGATATNNYALDVLAGAVHFGTGTLGVGIDATTGRVFNASGALTGNPAAGQHGMLLSVTSDGTFTGELVLIKVTLSGSTAASNTVARSGGFNLGKVVLPSGDTIQKFPAFSWDGDGLGAGVIANTVYGVDVGSVNAPSVTITDGSGGGGPTGLFVGYRVGAWAVTGSGTTTEYDGVLVKAPTFTTVGTAYGLKIESISGTTQGTSPTAFAINTAAGAVSLTVGTTVTSNAASLWDGFSIPASTLLLTGTTAVSGTNPGLNAVTIYQPTVSGGSAVSVTGTASTVTIQGGPLQAGAGPATLQNVRVLNIATANTTIRNIAQSTYYAVGIAAHQLILSQVTNNTNTNGINAMTLDQITINQTGGAVTVANSSTLNIIGPPIMGSLVTGTNIWSLRIQTGNVFFGGLLTTYNNVTTAGIGVPAVYHRARVLAQTAANASILSVTSVAADATYIFSANILMTAFTAGTISMTVAYTDEGNTARTATISFEQIAGTLTTTPGAAGAFEGGVITLRIKGATTITVATTAAGFTGTYNAEATFAQIA